MGYSKRVALGSPHFAIKASSAAESIRGEGHTRRLALHSPATPRPGNLKKKMESPSGCHLHLGKDKISFHLACVLGSSQRAGHFRLSQDELPINMSQMTDEVQQCMRKCRAADARPGSSSRLIHQMTGLPFQGTRLLATPAPKSWPLALLERKLMLLGLRA